MREKVIEIIRELTGFEKIEDVDLIEEDILDSLAFIELIEELNQTFNIDIQPTQVSGNTWRSIDSIVKMIEEKLDGKLK